MKSSYTLMKIVKAILLSWKKLMQTILYYIEIITKYIIRLTKYNFNSFNIRMKIVLLLLMSAKKKSSSGYMMMIDVFTALLSDKICLHCANSNTTFPLLPTKIAEPEYNDPKLNIVHFTISL